MAGTYLHPRDRQRQRKHLARRRRRRALAALGLLLGGGLVLGLLLRGLIHPEVAVGAMGLLALRQGFLLGKEE